MIKNILGQGIDIHLLGLRQLARQSGCAEATAVFQDSSYGIINHFALSTSQVTAILGFMGARGGGSVCRRKKKRIDNIDFCSHSLPAAAICRSRPTRTRLWATDQSFPTATDVLTTLNPIL